MRKLLNLFLLGALVATNSYAVIGDVNQPTKGLKGAPLYTNAIEFSICNRTKSLIRVTPIKSNPAVKLLQTDSFILEPNKCGAQDFRQDRDFGDWPTSVQIVLSTLTKPFVKSSFKFDHVKISRGDEKKYEVVRDFDVMEVYPGNNLGSSQNFDLYIYTDFGDKKWQPRPLEASHYKNTSGGLFPDSTICIYEHGVAPSTDNPCNDNSW